MAHISYISVDHQLRRHRGLQVELRLGVLHGGVDGGGGGGGQEVLGAGAAGGEGLHAQRYLGAELQRLQFGLHKAAS